MQKELPLPAIKGTPKTSTSQNKEPKKRTRSGHNIETQNPKTLLIRQDHRIHYEGVYRSILTPTAQKSAWRNGEPLRVQLIPSKDSPLNINPMNVSANKTTSPFIPKYHFKIEDSFFCTIEGNEKDKEICSYFENIKDRDFCFVITANDIDIIYIPSRNWQKRFVASVTKGLTSLIKMNSDPDSTIIPNTGGRTLKQVYQRRSIPPTCSQYLLFQNHGETQPYHLRGGQNKILPDLSQKELGTFSCLSLFTPGEQPNEFLLQHEFIHIGNNVCISKFGIGPIIFHDIDEIKDLYGKLYGFPVNLVRRSYLSESELQASSQERYETARDELDSDYASSESEYDDTSEHEYDSLEDL